MDTNDRLHQLTCNEFRSLAANLKLIPLKERIRFISNPDIFTSTTSNYIIPHQQNRESQSFSNFKSSLHFPPSYSEWRRLKQRNIQIVLILSQLLQSNQLLYQKITEMLSQLSQMCRAFFYGCEFTIVTEIPIEDMKARNRLHPQTNRIQYLAFDVIKYLEKKRPKNIFSIIAVTVEDLFPDYLANFVLGHANFKGGSGVISLGKYADQSNDIIRVSQTRLFWRLTKVLLHELTHTFGIAHCYDFACLMNPSGSIPEAESQTLFLCPYCIAKLSHILKFEFADRFHAMELAIFHMQRFSTELNIIWKEQSFHFNLYHLGVGSPCVDKENCEIELQRMDSFAKEKWEISFAQITELNKLLI
ncbi:Archaemetzincin-1-like [Oopsacas minuta]|uniref:Archaemetzincin-1-like n=1 Tax=Oopsacas minuta TaxID=111878 RepID=A0AAV7JB26_9METZ|nr:Archaemetzincin-1-like [Oopsacas minuta]